VAGHSQHRTRASDNEEFADAVSRMRVTCRGWEATALFYAAVHLVDAYLGKVHNKHPERHVQYDPTKPPGRNRLVQDHMSLVWDNYRQLQNLSHTARYDVAQELTDRQISRLRSRDYPAIKIMVDAAV